MRRTLSSAGRPVLFGQAPWGYRVAPDGTRLVLDENEAALTAVVRHMRASGRTLAQIVADLRDMGVVNRRGRPFTLGRVHEMLSTAGGLGIAPPQSLDEPVAPETKGDAGDPRLDVPAFARSYRVAELRLNPWTRRALLRAGMSTLADLHGNSGRALRALRGVNAAVVDELRALVEDVRSAGPRLRGNLLDALDEALGRLEEGQRDILLLRLGGTAAGPLSLPDVARRLGGGTGEAVRQREVRALAELRVLLGPAVGQVLRDAAARAAARDNVWADSLVQRLARASRRPRSKERLSFHARLLGRLEPGLANDES